VVLGCRRTKINAEPAFGSPAFPTPNFPGFAPQDAVSHPTIRQHPEQRFWLYKHWRYRPVEDAGRYPFNANYSEKFERELADTLGSQSGRESAP